MGVLRLFSPIRQPAWIAVTVAVGCLATCVIAFGSQSAAAYVLEGPRWPGQAAPHTCCATLTYRNIAPDARDFNAGTMGANAWNTSPAQVYLKTSLTGDITFEEANSASLQWDGLTTWSTYVGGNGVTYFKAGMTIQVNDYFLRGYSPAMAQSVSAHEFGHSVGLGHNYGCVLMNPYTNARFISACGYVSTPQADDVNGANALY